MLAANALKWSVPPAEVSLGPDEVHVWRATLERRNRIVDHFGPTLAEDEHQRAQRYHCPATRARFVVGRGLLRTVLAHYLAHPAEKLRFRLGSQGKPVLDHQCAPLHFNVTHSHELVLIAVTRKGAVGIDVERIRPFPNDLGLADRYFSAHECRSLRLVSPERRTEAFFHAWTRKEACLKAMGVGLSYGLDRVEVTIAPDEPVRLVRLNGEEINGAPWSLLGLLPAPGYAGALALRARDCRLIAWHWPDEESEVPVEDKCGVRAGIADL